jgi:hypothetical protein
MSGLDLENVVPQKFQVSKTAKLVMILMLAAGLLLLALGFYADKERAWHSYLTSFFFFTTIALGGMFFVAINHVSSAGWSTNIRRIPEALTAFLPYVFVLGLPIVFLANKDLFLWLDPDVVANDSILQGKAAYLNKTFFAIRFVAFTGVWFFFAKKIVGFSLNQDRDGADHWTSSAGKWSIPYLVIFALSFSLFSIDFMMSLEPHWFSTIFGIYCFSGMFQAVLAVMILICLFIIKKGWSNGLINIEHVHDLAKYMKGFTVFWAYIAFSQFMLIWYANLPEETIFYLHRTHGGWLYVSIALLVFRFIVPFLALLPRWAKRTPNHLVGVCLLILAMQYMDIFWLVYPNYSNEFLTFSWLEIGVFIGFLGGFGLVVAGFLTKYNLIPMKDPRRSESNDHHVIY